MWYIEADGLYIFQRQNSWKLHCAAKADQVNPLHCKKVDNLPLRATCCTVQHIWPFHIHSRFKFWRGPSQNLAFPLAAIDQINLLHGNDPAIINAMRWWPSNIPAILWQLTSYHQEVGIASLAFTWQPVTFRLMNQFPDSYWVKETGRLTHSHTYNINLTH